MTAPADSQISLSVRAGVGDPTTMPLPPGQAVGPLSVGRAGTWRVVAPGVLEEHAFLYFNGTDLFLQSADPNSPVTVNGSAIPGEWTAVYAPCEIIVGGARLWFGPPKPARSLPPATPSQPAPIDSPSAAGRRPFAPRVQGLDADDESTRLHPIEDIEAARKRLANNGPSATLTSPSSPPTFGPPPGGAPPAAPTFGAPIIGGPTVGAPTFGAPTFGAPPPGAPTFGAPPPADPAAFAPPGTLPAGPPLGAAPPAKPAPWIVARWREASGPKKALMLLLIPLIWAVWVIFTDKPQPARTTTKTSPSASASASSSARAASSAAPSPSNAPSSDPEPPAPPPSPSGKASASPASPTTTTATKTREREAADAVAAGAFDKAARLYDELSKAHPEVPAYAEAARIMKAKSGKR
ncbi:Cell division protein FtsK [Minicystis rosea]|nr:Cell division protein FtsK [Minicystis rosea]